MDPQTLMVFLRCVREMVFYDMFHQIGLGMSLSLTFIPSTLESVIHRDIHWRFRLNRDVIVQQMMVKFEERSKWEIAMVPMTMKTIKIVVLWRRDSKLRWKCRRRIAADYFQWGRASKLRAIVKRWTGRLLLVSSAFWTLLVPEYGLLSTDRRCKSYYHNTRRTGNRILLLHNFDDRSIFGKIHLLISGTVHPCIPL